MNNANITLKALDALALALADHHHIWSAEERALYESAVHILSLGEGAEAND